MGLVDEARWQAFTRKRDAIDHEQRRLHDLWVRPDTSQATRLAQLSGEQLNSEQRIDDLLRRPQLDYATLMQLDGIGPGTTGPVAEQVEIQAKYQGYIERQREEIARQQRHEHKPLPENFDYLQVRGLSSEVREKLLAVRPETIGQAARIPGVTPAAVSLLLVHLKKTGLARKSA